MRYAIILLLVFQLPLSTAFDKEEYEIIGQKTLTVEQGKSITILLTDLILKDAEEHRYPDKFKLKVYDGDHYSRNDDTITPDKNFTGELEVPVRVQKHGNESNKFRVKIRVTAPAAPTNTPPAITGQKNLSIEKNQSLTINFSDLTVSDPDDNYPNGFSMTIREGKDFTVSGNVITPKNGFTGTLTAAVTVNDGQDNSAPFDLKIEVVDNSVSENVAPVITGQRPLSIQENTSLQIQFSDLTVTDPDNKYPNGFTLLLAAGNNYGVNQTIITPVADFVGTLTVPVAVNDGKANSAPFSLLITVTEKVSSRTVQITGQLPLNTSENKSISISLSDLVVSDSGNGYPEGFALSISPGTNYTIENNSVLPNIDFVGELSIPVSVNAGSIRSNVFDLKITVVETEDFTGIPAAFTPNNDNANDTWGIKSIKNPEAYGTAIVRVYNKSGLLVFESKGTDGEWDGKFNGQFLPAETYFYTIEADALRPDLNRKGILMLLR